MKVTLGLLLTVLQIPVPSWLEHRIRDVHLTRFILFLVSLGISARVLRNLIHSFIVTQRAEQTRQRKLLQREPLYVQMLAEEDHRSSSASSSSSSSSCSDSSLAADLALLSHDIASFVSGAAQRRVRVSDVIAASLRQAVRAQRRHACLTETCFAQAVEQARQLDEWMDAHGEVKGNLHGVPITVKDSVNLRGLDTTLGLTAFCFQPAPDDALIVNILRDAGAVIIAKTNVPQTLLSFECGNPIWGRTTNPYNPTYTSGGSSGGESVMLACRASCVGIGTDIGGSVRIPAHFSGNFALKPTSRRLSLKGFRPSVPGQEAIPGVAGILSNSVDDIIRICHELFSEAAWLNDHDVVNLPFDPEQCQTTIIGAGTAEAQSPSTTPRTKLRVGYYIDDGVAPASPACVRAVLETVEALRGAGHHVTLFEPPRIFDAIELYYSLIACDGAVTLLGQLEDEVWEDYVVTMMRTVQMPRPVKRVLSWLVANVMKDEKAARLMAATGQRTVAEVWKLQYARRRYRQEFFDAWQNENNKFDVLICPAHALPAVTHHSYKRISHTCSYTMLYNVLDLPAGVVPITSVLPTDVYTSRPNGILDSLTRKFYNPVQQQGLPVGIQVVGLPFEDETVLRAMKIISELKPFTVKPPLAQI